ncbi:MAG: Gfo/Idh/MocA family oxidoreductase [Myxococcota bacterium]
MSDELRLAVVGVGRIGTFHARHAAELAACDGSCRLAALVDPRRDLPALASQLSSIQGSEVGAFPTLEALLEAETIDATVVASPTALHREHAQALIAKGQRVLVEKPLTPSLAEDRAFAAELDTHQPNALMLAFQRRFDAPLLHAKSLLDSGRIGRPFKFVSILEDSRLMPEGYESPGLLQDMSVHNVDEVLWLSGKSPNRVKAQGSRLYTHRIAPVEEDFDDALLQLDFDGEAVAQIQVSRNHVAGYRVETWIFGEEGVVHSGGFHQNSHEVVVEAYGRNEPIEIRTFPLRDYGTPVPEFIDRFGDAYAAELHAFVRHGRDGTPFPVDHGDAVRAMAAIDEGVRSMHSAAS